MPECIVFTGGGTGGHVFPALAVYQELKSRWDGRVVWIGSRGGMEQGVVPSLGIPFYGIPSGKLRRYWSLANLTDVFRIAGGFAASLFLLLRERPGVLFSKGGYVSVPPCAAARLLGIPVVTHESDLRPGLATRINTRFARSILVSFESSPEFFPGRLRSRVTVTGNPVRAALERGSAAEGRRLVGCPPGRRLLLVLGGSQGSAFLNSLVRSALPQLLAQWFVVHQMGPAQHRPQAAQGYHAAPFFHDELPHLLAAASLVLCRAGANTLFELAALGRPAVLVPLAEHASRGDQIDNARYFAERGAAVVLEEREASAARVTELVLQLGADPAKLEGMGRNARSLGRPQAAARVAEVLLEARRRGLP